jgi:hypothetical protein
MRNTTRRIITTATAGLLVAGPIGAVLAPSAFAIADINDPANVTIIENPDGQNIMPLVATIDMATIDRSGLARDVDGTDRPAGGQARVDPTPAGDGTVIQNPGGMDIMPINAPISTNTTWSGWPWIAGVLGLTTLASLGWAVSLRSRISRTLRDVGEAVVNRTI